MIAGAYVLGACLGRGGMGVVYEAALGRANVAIKLLLPEHQDDPIALRRLRSEGIAARYITHPNVIAVLDVGDPGAATPFIAMERVYGSSLGSVIRMSGPLPARRATLIALQLLAALEAAHAAGVVHGDTKSDNVLLARRGVGETVKLIDFGLAEIHRVDHPPPMPMFDRHGQRLTSGTPGYMAPEIIRGEGAIAQSDLYGVGAVMYEMLTGTTPFASASAQLSEPLVPPSFRRPDRFIPYDLETAIVRALARDPAARFQTAAELSEALITALPDRDETGACDAHDAIASEAVTRDVPVMFDRKPPKLEVDERALAAQITRLRQGLRKQPLTSDVAIVTALELVRSLVDAHDLRTAARELETILSTSPFAPQLWRLTLTLGALYHGLGDTMRARRHAAAAHHQATLHHSDVGRTRASRLLARLSR
ncbi:MAG: serine/threonine-protein kinase [Kofleriaceae bacterium]